MVRTKLTPLRELGPRKSASKHTSPVKISPIARRKSNKRRMQSRVAPNPRAPKRPAQKMTYQNFVYSLLRSKPQKNYWHCTRTYQRKKCTGRVHTNHQGQVILKAGEHHHPPTAFGQADGIRAEPNGIPVGRARLFNIAETGNQDQGPGPSIPVNTEVAATRAIKADLHWLEPEDDDSVSETHRRAPLAVGQTSGLELQPRNWHTDVITLDETDNEALLPPAMLSQRASQIASLIAAQVSAVTGEWLDNAAHRYSAGDVALRSIDHRNDVTVEVLGTFKCSACDSKTKQRCYEKTSRCVICCRHEKCSN
ncbi:FLYWCH zinc finger domain-containing protein [Ditylenchus destructor]|uniref:FLYWCH zinc finger domain-containing protein n=1 Tax=Ditylenchus destructor TaxID=166010 RepID=A0AAD4N3K2_9BILA|nr:FLYWCH zinc finger domain-containing protein [Ditylenchus destructor]